MDYRETANAIEELVKQHKIAESVKILDSLVIREIPGELRATFANLARRCDNTARALKILAPNIHEVARVEPNDLIEYAATIRRAGLANQSLLLLSRVANHTQAHFHRALGHIALFDYAQAKDHLELYLLSKEISEYQRRVASVNLMAALVALGEFERAEEIYGKYYGELSKNHPHLAVGLDELLGQICFLRGNDEKCLEILNRLERENEGQTSGVMYFVKKWRTLAMSRLNKDEKLAKEFREYSRVHNQYDGLRQFDLFWALIHGDQKLLNYVYFGSPEAGFRSLIPARPEPGSTFVLQFQAEAVEPQDPHNSKIFGVPFALNLHRLCLMLVSDFYRPWTVERIHDSLFQHEIYDPDRSSKKIYQMMLRLKNELPKECPLELMSTPAGYRLRAKPGCSITVYQQMVFKESGELFSEVLQKNFGANPFSIENIAEVASATVPQLRRHLSGLLDVARVDRIGRSHYRLKKSA